MTLLTSRLTVRWKARVRFPRVVLEKHMKLNCPKCKNIFDVYISPDAIYLREYCPECNNEVRIRIDWQNDREECSVPFCIYRYPAISTWKISRKGVDTLRERWYNRIRDRAVTSRPLVAWHKRRVIGMATFLLFSPPEPRVKDWADVSLVSLFVLQAEVMTSLTTGRFQCKLVA